MTNHQEGTKKTAPLDPPPLQYIEGGRIYVRIKSVRNHLGCTQKDISEHVGCKFRAWQSYESGKSIPGGKVLAGLSKLGVNVDWVLTGDGEMMDNTPKDDSPSIPGMPHSAEQAQADMYDDIIHHDKEAAARRDEQFTAISVRLKESREAVDRACKEAEFSPPEATYEAIKTLSLGYNIHHDDLVMLINQLKYDLNK